MGRRLGNATVSAGTPFFKTFTSKPAGRRWPVPAAYPPPSMVRTPSSRFLLARGVGMEVHAGAHRRSSKDLMVSTTFRTAAFGARNGTLAAMARPRALQRLGLVNFDVAAGTN